jgi:hypothetical protein
MSVTKLLIANRGARRQRTRCTGTAFTPVEDPGMPEGRRHWLACESILKANIGGDQVRPLIDPLGPIAVFDHG